MDKIWLKQYPAGIPAEVDVRAYRSLKEILETTCGRFADLPAYGNMGVSITYRELLALSRDFGAYLQKVAGLKRGDRLAIMLPNLLQYPVALIGALRAGLTVVNVNPLYTAAELQFQLADSGAAAVVVLENFAHALEHALAGTRETGYTTTLKLMQIMADKGLVKRNESARTHVYAPIAGEQQTQRQLVKDLVDRAFGGSAAALVMQALNAEGTTADDLREIRKLIDDHREKRK